MMVPGDWEQYVKLLSCQQTCILWDHKGQHQAQCKFKELLVLKLTWESSIKASKVLTSNCLHVCFPCEYTIPIWNFPGLYPSLFWYKMLERKDFHERSSILYSYSLVDDLEKTSKYKIIPLRKGRVLIPLFVFFLT